MVAIHVKIKQQNNTPNKILGVFKNIKIKRNS